jgi:hypothetical protein
VLGEPTFGLLREDDHAVDEDVELALPAWCRVSSVTIESVDLGRETRGPCVVARSGRAVEDANGAHVGHL